MLFAVARPLAMAIKSIYSIVRFLGFHGWILQGVRHRCEVRGTRWVEAYSLLPVVYIRQSYCGQGVESLVAPGLRSRIDPPDGALCFRENAYFGNLTEASNTPYDLPGESIRYCIVELEDKEHACVNFNPEERVEKRPY